MKAVAFTTRKSIRWVLPPKGLPKRPLFLREPFGAPFFHAYSLGFRLFALRTRSIDFPLFVEFRVAVFADIGVGAAQCRGELFEGTAVQAKHGSAVATGARNRGALLQVDFFGRATRDGWRPHEEHIGGRTQSRDGTNTLAADEKSPAQGHMRPPERDVRQGQCAAVFEKSWITATPATIRPMPSMAGRSRRCP